MNDKWFYIHFYGVGGLDARIDWLDSWQWELIGKLVELYTQHDRRDPILFRRFERIS